MTVSGITGAMLVTHPIVASGGARGATLGFRRALKAKRAVHLTCEFMLQSENLTGGMLEVMEQRHSCWTVVSCDDMIDLAARRKAREVSGCMTAAELDEYPFIQSRFTVQTAIANEFVCKLDLARCPAGVCDGR